jgi:hypothetical protein
MTTFSSNSPSSDIMPSDNGAGSKLSQMQKFNLQIRLSSIRLELQQTISSSFLLVLQPSVGLALLHRFQSSDSFFHPCTLRILRCFSTPSSHLRLGLQALLLLGVEKVSFLQGDILFALAKCPSHLSLPSLRVFTISGASYKLYSSQRYFIHHPPFSPVDPQIFQSTFLLKVLSVRSLPLIKVQLSLPYISTSFSMVLQNMPLVSLFRYLDLSVSFNPW